MVIQATTEASSGMEMDVIKPSCRSLQRLLIAVYAVGILLAGTPVVMAAADPGLASRLYKEAKALYEEGRIRDSLDKLRAAYEAYASDKLLLSIANRHLDLGEPEEAQETLSRIAPETAEMRTQVQRLRKQVTAELQRPVAVKLSTDVRDATVSVDGGPPRDLPLRLQLPRGKHRFLFRSPDGTSREVGEILRGSMEQLVNVPLTNPVGRWRLGLDPVGSLQDVRVSIDGVEVELTEEERSKPVTQPREVEPGSHSVVCLRGIDERAEVKLVAVNGELVVVTCSFAGSIATSAGDRQTWAWVSAGGALAAVVSSVVLYLSYQQDLEKYADDRYVIASSKPAAYIGLGIGGAVLAGLGTYLFLTE